MSHHNNMRAIDIDSRRQAHGIQLEELESLIRKFSRNLCFSPLFPPLDVLKGAKVTATLSSHCRRLEIHQIKQI